MAFRVYRRVKEWGGDRDVLCRAVCVYDGDGFLASGECGRFMLRVWGIDAPEYGQPFFEESRVLLRGLVKGGDLRCSVKAVDRYGRWVCRVVNGSGVNVSSAMVMAGMAWWYWSWARGDIELRECQQKARAAARGLWADGRAVPPWEFRKERIKARRR